MITWNGTADEFWDALEHYRKQTDTNADGAILSEVLTTARLAKMLREREPLVQELLRALEYERLGDGARKAFEAVRAVKLLDV